jgi:hypothetical protein
MADAFFGMSEGTSPEQLAADAEARRRLSLDRAMRELPQQIAGVGLTSYGNQDPLTMRVDEMPGEPSRVTPSEIRSEMLGLQPGYAGLSPSPQTTAPYLDAVLRPGYAGPAGVADWLRSEYGELEDRPGYNNAAQYARSGAQYAKARAGSEPTAALQEEYRKSQFLMPPERAEYMKGPGRAIDVLQNLNADPERAMQFWDRSSPNAEVKDGRPSERNLSRTDYNDPIYQRFSGDNMTPWITGVSPTAVALRRMDFLPKTWAFAAAESPSITDALLRSRAAMTMPSRVNVGSETPIADLPDDASEDANLSRMKELGTQFRDSQEPPKQNVANSVVAGLYNLVPHISASAWAGQPVQESELARPAEPPQASPFVADLVDAFRGWADGSQAMGLLSPSSFARSVVKDLGQEAAIETGLRQAIAPGLPEDMVAYVTQGMPSEELDFTARRAAADAALRDDALKPQSIYDARDAAYGELMTGDPVTGVPGKRRSVLGYMLDSLPKSQAWAGPR